MLPFDFYMDPRGSEMPGPKLERRGVPQCDVSLKQALAEQARAAHAASVDAYVASVAREPQKFIVPNAVQQAKFIRLQDAEQVEVSDLFKAQNLEDETVRQLVASLAVHGRNSALQAAGVTPQHDWGGPVNMW